MFVRHPISDQTKEQIHARADEAFPAIVDALTLNIAVSARPAPAPAAVSKKAAGVAEEEEEEECST